jgi:hypothetical protein
LQIKTQIISHTVDSKPVKQEVNGTVILPPLVFPDLSKQPFKVSLVADDELGDGVDAESVDLSDPPRANVLE